MRLPRLLFAGNFNWNAGSSHTIAGYVTAAELAGCHVAVSTQLADVDSVVATRIPLVDDVRWATHLVLVFEGRQFLDERQIELCNHIPRGRRAVIDPDGHWGSAVHLGADNNFGRYSSESWNRLYRKLSDRVLQPKISGALEPDAEFFPYFGMPPICRDPLDMPAPDDLPYQVQYIGNNWWRWPSLTRAILAASSLGPTTRRMRVCGRWWNGETREGHEAATYSEPGWLQRHGVQVNASVPFGQIIAEMAQSALTPVLARPLLANLGLLTPRMFETIAAGSMPIIDSDLAYLPQLYGEDATAFVLGDDPHETVAQLFRDYTGHREALARIQSRMASKFSYERNLARLIKLLS